MAKIEELFHKLGNWHNKISVAAGFTKAELKRRFKDTTIPAEIEKVLARLSLLEKQAVKASKVLDRLKVAVYKRINPHINKPRKTQRKGCRKT